jgi:hypothetical protein
MVWDDIRIAFLVTYSVLTTNFLVLNAPSIPANLEFLPDKRSSDKCPEIEGKKMFSVNNCTYQWPEASTTIVLSMCLLKRNYKHRTRWYDDYGDGMTSCVME